MKKHVPVISLLVLCLCLAPAIASASYEGPGFDTPEKAVSRYLLGLGEQDIPTMLSAFAIETYAEHYDFEAQMERLGVFSIGVEIKFPSTNEVFTRYNIEARRSRISDSILYQYMTYVFPGRDFYAASPLTEEAEMEAFLAQYEAADARPNPFEGLELVEFMEPGLLTDLYDTERSQELLQARADICGADEMRSMAALLTLDGVSYLFCCNVLRYGDAWYMGELGGHLASFLAIDGAFGGLFPLM